MQTQISEVKTSDSESVCDTTCHVLRHKVLIELYHGPTTDLNVSIIFCLLKEKAFVSFLIAHFVMCELHT